MSAEKMSRTSDDTSQGPSGAASTVTAEQPALTSAAPETKRRSLFGRKRPAPPSTYAEKLADQALDVNPDAGKQAADLTPVSFSSLFR
jgi:hypothetical protein